LSKEAEAGLVVMLRKVSLFAGLKDKQLRSIASGGKESSYSAGQTIIEEGKSGVGFYLIVDGKVSVRKGKKVLAELGSSEFFGEMSLFDRQARSATVEAVTDTKCLVISAWSFIALVRTDPDIAVNMMKELAGRLRLSNKALSE
jgi:CRP/FNR family cyclic AMP-dependent transcriptional regulator